MKKYLKENLEPILVGFVLAIMTIYRTLLKLGHSQSKIAKIFKINRNVVLNISQNKTYKNIA